jgi:hypothetical protein
MGLTPTTPQIRFILAAGVFFCMSAKLAAQTWGTSGDFQTIEYADRVTVRGTVNAPSGVLQIPASINGKPVTAIADWAFDYSPALTGVALPSSLIEIGRGAFQGCNSLQSVSVPSGVTAIADSTFAYCSSLSSVSLPASVTSIGESAFRDCDNLASIVIPQGVTIIGNSAFDDCALLKTVTFPSSLRSIGGYAFDDCASLESVVLPEGLSSIGQWAFATCSALTSAKLPSTLTSLGPYAFYQCRSLNEISIPAVTNIGDYAFAQCDALARATIAAGVGSIGEYAFFDCPSLTSISIPPSVTAIGKYAFYYCSGLVTATIAPGISRIPEGLFQQCSSLTTANIPQGVTSIGSYAFQNCSLLASISMPSTVTSIGNAAFRDCSGLSSVVLSAKLTSIPPNAFQSCSNLATVNIPSGVTTIGEWAFSGCSGLTEAVIPATVLSIGQWAFAYASLAKIELPDSVTSIGQYAFYQCSSAQSLRLPSGLAGVANYAFSDCRSLTSITFPTALQSIGEGAFQDVSVVSLALPPGLITIGAYAFQNSDQLQSVRFPASVNSIGASAFSSCERLIRAEFLGNAPSLGSSAFAFAANNFAVHYQSGAVGFTTPKWQNYPSQVAIPTLSVVGAFSSFNTKPGTTSAAQTFTVSGYSLTSNVTVAAPAGFELSVDGGGYASSLSLTPSSGTISGAVVSVRVSASAPSGLLAGNVAVSSSGATFRNLSVSGAVVGDPALSVAGTLSSFVTTSGTASAAQTFTVSGSNLTSNVTVAAPAGFEVSVGGGNFTSSLTLAPSAGVLSATSISVRISAGAPVGSPSGNVVASSTRATSRSLAISGSVAPRPSPALDIVGTLSSFTTTAGTASAAQTFTVSGSNLTSNVTVAAPAGFEVSVGGGNFTSSLTLAPSAGVLSATSIPVRLSATATIGSAAGNVVITSTGAVPRIVPVSSLVQSAGPPPGLYVGNFNSRDDYLSPASSIEAIESLGQLLLNSSGKAFSMVTVVEGATVRTKGQVSERGPTKVFIIGPRTKSVFAFAFSYLAGEKTLSVNITRGLGERFASLMCHPASYDRNVKPFPLAGRTFNSLVFCSGPQGRGFVSAKVALDGSVNLSGRLPDNTAITGTARLVSGPDGDVMAYLSLPLPRAKSLLWGAARLEISPGSTDATIANDPDAPVIWASLPDPKRKRFPGGLLAFCELRGRLWPGSTKLNALTGDVSETAFSVLVGENAVEFNGKCGVSNKPVWDLPLPKNAVLKVNPATGALSGMLPTATGSVPLAFKGLLVTPGFEEMNNSILVGGGFLLGSTNSTAVELVRPGR